MKEDTRHLDTECPTCGAGRDLETIDIVSSIVKRLRERAMAYPVGGIIDARMAIGFAADAIAREFGASDVPPR